MKQSPFSKICVALALCAMVWAQLFGLQWGYLAEVEGRWVQTFASHHHQGDSLNSGHFVFFLPHDHQGEKHQGHDHELHYGKGDCASQDEDSSCCGEGPAQNHVPLEIANEMLSSRGMEFNSILPVFEALAVWQWMDVQKRPVQAAEASMTVPKGRLRTFVPLVSVEISSCTVLLV